MSRRIWSESRDWLLYLDDLIAHHYFAVDPQIVWEAATMHLPVLLRGAKNLRSRVEAG